MNKNVLLVGGAAAIALIAFSGKVAYNATRITFLIAKLGFRMSGLTPYIDIDVMIQNPAGSQFELTAFVADLLYNGTNIGNASSYTALTIKPYSETKLVIPVRLSLLGAGSTLLNLFQSGNVAGATVRVKGTATVDYIPIPVDIAGNLI